VNSPSNPAVEQTRTVAVAGTTSTDHSAKSSALAIAVLALSALIFSTGGLFVRSLDHPHAWTTVLCRSIAACVSLILLIVFREKRNPISAITTMGKPGLGVAAAFAASSIGMVVALSQTTVAIVLVIFALSPLVAALMAWAMLGEKVHSYTWVAIAVTVGGVAFMVSGPGAGGITIGALIAFLIPLSFGYGAVVIRQHANIAMTPAMLLAMMISAVIALPFARPFDLNRHDFLLLMLFGFAQLGLGLALFSAAAPRIPATEVALLAMLEPIAGPIWVWAFHGEYPGVSGLIGGSVVFVALAVHTVVAASKSSTVATLP
jgi:drug/metabolite transporter (DMT)-like permease